MSTTQFVSKFNARAVVPPVISGIERINLKNGCIIYPGTDGHIYGMTTTGTIVNLTGERASSDPGMSSELAANLEATMATLSARMGSIELLLERVISLLTSVTDVNVTTTPSV